MFMSKKFSFFLGSFFYFFVNIYGEDPFEDIVTRFLAILIISVSKFSIQKSSTQEKGAPETVSKRKERIRENAEKLVSNQAVWYGRRPLSSLLYYVYPSLYPKGVDYCPQMRVHFRYHCQPSKPLRLDLVEFCKDYSNYCNVINYHRLLGPGLGPPKLRTDQGYIGVNGNFGFGLGVVPGLEIDAGWGVDVGPLPIGDSVGVGVGLNLGLLGATAPEKYRRGMDSPGDRRSGLVGINGGVGVDAGGVPVGVNSGIGIG